MSITPENTTPQKMKPMMVVRKGLFDADTIKACESNGIIIIECDDPKAYDFIANVPLPCLPNARNEIETAAVRLVTEIIAGNVFQEEGMKTVSLRLMKILFSPNISAAHKAARDAEIFDSAKADEIRKIAREEAREERAKIKAAKIAAIPKKI